MTVLRFSSYAEMAGAANWIKSPGPVRWVMPSNQTFDSTLTEQTARAAVGRLYVAILSIQ